MNKKKCQDFEIRFCCRYEQFPCDGTWTQATFSILTTAFDIVYKLIVTEGLLITYYENRDSGSIEIRHLEWAMLRLLISYDTNFLMFVNYQLVN